MPEAKYHVQSYSFVKLAHVAQVLDCDCDKFLYFLPSLLVLSFVRCKMEFEKILSVATLKHPHQPVASSRPRDSAPDWQFFRSAWVQGSRFGKHTLGHVQLRGDVAALVHGACTCLKNFVS